MTEQELNDLLKNLITTWENEVVEFKQADEKYDTDKIGKYFSALSNEANLRGMGSGWLVLGVDDKTRSVVGTNYRTDAQKLQSLKLQMDQGTQPSVTFLDIHEYPHADGRVLLLEVPAAPRGMPIAWQGHYYARAGESLTALHLNKFEKIRQQTLNTDWTAQQVPGATLAHLDEQALQVARRTFAKKHPELPESEVMDWPILTFLERANLLREGQITRATLLLLGQPTAAHWLLPHPAQMTWNLKGPERAYEHFSLPFLLTTSKLYQRIRNVQIRILPDHWLIPVEVSKYDRRVVLEALHNCIAHQDYERSGRIVVTEDLAALVFENQGKFFDGQPEDYMEGKKVPGRYRNHFLAQAMTKLNMIDTMGYGIYSMYREQAKRYLPMPDYDTSQPNVVRITVHGGVVDPAYSRLLMQKTDLPLSDVLALDRLQKRLPITDAVATGLKRKGLIEGRKPHWHVSAVVAKATDDRAAYIKTRSQDDEFYAKLLMDYLEKFGQASRQDIDQLLLPKLSDALGQGQKINKISNLLTKLRRKGDIVNKGSDRIPRWQVAEKKR